MKHPGIYAIVHVDSGRRYVGSSLSVARRWSDHRRDLRGRRHPNRPLQRAWTACGESAFRFEVLERVDDVTQLLVREQAHIDKYEPLVFNHGPASPSPTISEEGKARLRALAKVRTY